MGMHTAFRLDIELMPEFIPVIQAVYDVNEPGTYEVINLWEKVFERFPQYYFLGKWMTIDRANFIPFGGWELGSYHQWEEEDSEWPKYNAGRPTSTRWKFQCCLKNYEGEIQTFMGVVVAEIAAEIHYAAYLYCENEEPTILPEPLKVKQRRLWLKEEELRERHPVLELPVVGERALRPFEIDGITQ